MNRNLPVLLENPDFVVVLISNGPGELTTWVKPIASKLEEEIRVNPKYQNHRVSLRLVLVPCPNATGKEFELSNKWKIFEKITHSSSFWNLIINPKRFGYWPAKGIVVFLGGDQFWNVLLSARLKYKSITYAEWIARWPFWNDRIAAMSPKVKKLLPKKLHKRCKIVGDLMADIKDSSDSPNIIKEGRWIALLPGSKKAKLMVGIPFFLEMVDHMAQINPSLNFLLPIAPTTNIKEFKKYSSSKNPISSKYMSGIKTIRYSNKYQSLITKNGTNILLIDKHPAHEYLSQCDLALTTVGANTAELGALAVPMIVILPTQHLAVMQAWDGFLGIIGRLPGLKWCLGKLISLWRMRKKRFFAWPNITANQMIVPERIGNISPKEIALEATKWMSLKENLNRQKDDLKRLRGKPGAVDALSKEILDLLLKQF